MSITYRYHSVTEGILVYETRAVGEPAPTVSINDGGAITAGSLTIVERPVDVSDLVVQTTVDFTNANVSNLSHTALEDIGTNTHADIDAHIADDTLHRRINDAGTSTTDLWSADKISTLLTGKTAVGHTHVAANITDFDSAADARITAQRGQANGLATLGADSKIPSSQIPSIAITDVHVVADIAARDALSPQTGDVAKVIDNGSGSVQTYIYDGSSWVDIQETSDVVSVNGQTGAGSLSSTHVPEGTNKYYTEERVSANTEVAANTTHRGLTNNPHSVTIDQVTTATSKGDLIAHSGVEHVVQGVGSNGQILQADSTQASGLRWADNKKCIVSSKNMLKTTSSAWTRMDHFIYPGSSIAASNVSRILVNADADPGVTYKLRIYDVTSGTEIAVVTGKNNQNPEVINMGVLNNVPSGDALLEVHAARTAGTGTNGAVYHSVMVEYQ